MKTIKLSEILGKNDIKVYPFGGGNFIDDPHPDSYVGEEIGKIKKNNKKLREYFTGGGYEIVFINNIPYKIERDLNYLEILTLINKLNEK